MFGLYPAGPSWVRHFSACVSARLLQQDLVTFAGFTASIFHQPFGVARGAALAQRDGCVVLADSSDSDKPAIVVVPDVAMQNLLWSFDTGYASQWSGRELKALTGCDDWAGLLRHASSQFAKVCADVERAVAGKLAEAAPVQTSPLAGTTDPVVSASFHNDDDAPWLPSDYFFDTPVPEVPSCGL